MDERLTQEQMSRLREALRGQELEAIVLLALATGMRRDELLQLRWQEIDVDQREVLVWDTKAQSGWRTVRFPENVADLLKQHRLRQRPTRRPAGRAASHLDLVFPDDTGGILQPAALVKRWSAFLAQAALPPLHLHDLRRAHQWTLRERSRAAGEEHREGQA
jgi:integrase